MKFIDTNIFVRYLTKDDPVKAAAYLALFQRVHNFHLPQRAIYLRALELYEMHPTLDFEDVLSVAHMEQTGVQELFSYDRDFDRIQGVTRQEP